MVPAFPSRAAELQLAMARVELNSDRQEAAETRVGKILRALTVSALVPDLLNLRAEARLKRAQDFASEEAIPLLSSAVQDFDDAARQQVPGDSTRLLAAQARLQRGLARWDALQSRSVAGVMEWGPDLINAACDLRTALPDLDGDQTTAALEPVERRCQQEVETLRSCLGRSASPATDAQYRGAVNWLSLAIALWPKNPLYVYYRGIAYSEPNHTTPDYERAIKDLRQFEDLIGNDTTAESVKRRINALNRLALIWATCPEPQLRDGKSAVESAGRARGLCQMLDEDEQALRLRANVSLALAAAHAEVGDFEAAVRDVEQIRDELSDQPGEQYRQIDAEFKFLGEKFRGRTPYRDSRKWVPQDDPFVCTTPPSPSPPAQPAD